MSKLAQSLPVQDACSALAAARSFLFVPANRPERFPKALASGADAVIIDLEDAVAPRDKAAARGQLADAFGLFSEPERARLLVRMNACGTLWQDDDLRLLQQLAAQGLAGVMVPKAETVADLQRVAHAVGPACALLPQVESVAGLDAADALATAPQVLRLAFGNLDFQADLGLASRRAGLPAPVDGVNAAFAPSTAELLWAQRVMAAFAAAGGGVFSLDGRMVDAPVLRLAQRTLAQSRPTLPKFKVPFHGDNKNEEISNEGF